MTKTTNQAAEEVVFGRDTYIFDIDDTLTDTRHRAALKPPAGTTAASAYREFTAQCWKDTPLFDVICTLMMLNAAGFRIILKTGRAEEFRSMTENYLAYCGIPYSDLIMLPDDFDGDYGEWKASQLDNDIIGGKDRAVAVFDDHPQSVAAYRAAGVTVMQVHHRSDDGDQPSPLMDSGLYAPVDLDDDAEEDLQ